MNIVTPVYEEQIARLFATGSEQALAWFHQQYYSSIALFSFHLTKDQFLAEEIAADAFIKTWKHHRKLDSVSAIKAYLYAVARHACFRTLKKKNRANNTLITLPEICSAEKDAFQLLIAAELSRQLAASFTQLSPGMKTVLSLHFLQGKTLTEIAAELRLSPSTVKTQKQRGLNTLKKKFTRHLLFFSLLM